MSYNDYSGDLSIVMVLPKPLEEYSKADQRRLCEEKVRGFIDESDFNFLAPKSADGIKSQKQRDSYCRRIYQNTSSSSDFDYLYRNLDKKVKNKSGHIKTLTLKQPAKVRHIPIVSPKLRALISREKMRPFKARAYAVDKGAIGRKSKARSKEIVDKVNERIVNRINAIELQRATIEQKKQLMQQYQNVPGAEEMLMQMNIMISSMQEQIERELLLEKEERDSIEKYYKYSHKDIQELLSLKLINSYIENHRLRTLFNKAFEEKLVTDKPVYYVDYIKGEDAPRMELVYPEYFDYQYSEDCEYIDELGWAVRLKYMTFQQIIISYGKFLTEDQVEQIKAEMPRQHARSTSNLDRTPDAEYVGLDDRHHNNAHNELYPVYQAFWKEYVGVPALIKKNNKPSKYLDSKPDFIKFLKVEEARKMVDTDAKKKRMRRKGEKIEVRYRVDLWEGLQIGESTFPILGKRDYEHRDSNNISDVKLPFIGRNVHRFSQARSLVWETRDIQELYNILHYQEELHVALAGVRGIVYDLAQKPEGMSPAEVNYYMRQGIMYIKTVKKNNKKVNSSFNQFQTYDQSLSPSVSLIEQMKQSLINLVSMITGVYANLEGAVANSDQVGTMKMSIQQSSASVETYFQEHEDLIERALTRLANLYESSKDVDRIGTYALNKLEQDLFNIPAGTLEGQFKILVNAGLKEQEAIDNAKNIGLNKLQSGQIQGSEYMTMQDMDNLHEIREFFAESEKKMYEIAQQSQQAGEQAKAQAQQQAIQMQSEMDMRLAQFKAQADERMKQMELQLKGRELELKEMTIASEEKQAKEKLEVAVHKIETEKDIELQYLDFQKQELVVNSETQRVQIMLQDMKNKMEIATKSKSKERIKD